MSIKNGKEGENDWSDFEKIRCHYQVTDLHVINLNMWYTCETNDFFYFNKLNAVEG